MSPDIAASIHARLLRPARERGEQFELTLARYAAERFLYRLGNSGARDRCILKGASLLSVWFKDPYRATRDIDVLASGPVDEQAIRALVDEVCGVPCPEDGLRFDLANLAVEDIRGDDEYAGKRARFRAFLGKARIRVQIDLGVGDAVAIPSETIVYPTLLPALPAPSLRAYPREVALAGEVPRDGEPRHTQQPHEGLPRRVGVDRSLRLRGPSAPDGDRRVLRAARHTLDR